MAKKLPLSPARAASKARRIAKQAAAPTLQDVAQSICTTLTIARKMKQGTSVRKLYRLPDIDLRLEANAAHNSILARRLAREAARAEAKAA